MLEWSDERKARLIGALLHDIGKFQYRAEKTNVPHEENSARFIREYLSKHECLKPFINEAIRFASTHHQDIGDYALRKADHLASGEREEQESREARRPLFSVFNHISNIKKNVSTQTKEMFFRPGPISIKEEDIFPQEYGEELSSEELSNLHKPHWESFQKEIKSIPKNLKFREFANTLLAILEKWTSKVSSAGYKTLPDISLYDHSRVAAAYADCISESDNDEKPFLVIEGDISGIQSFIYRLANVAESEQKGTAKTLRGRSFLIGLYSDAIAQFILDQLSLLNVHLLMNGGGGFTILVPNNQKARNKLLELRQLINRWLFKKFGGDIGLTLVWEAFSKEEIQQFNLVKRSMLQKIADAKFQKNLDLLDDEEFWGPTKYEDIKLAVCNSCGAYFDKKNSEDNICFGCLQQISIGKILPYANTLLLIKSDEKFMLKVDGIEPIAIPEFSQTWVLVRERYEDQRDLDIIRTLLRDLLENATIDIIRINNTDFSNLEWFSINDASKHSKCYRFNFIGNYTPKNEQGGVKSFEEMAQEIADEQEGYPLLAVLRMDVDSLGAIFAYGISGERQTISRIANLSRLFVQFFSGYLNEIAKKYGIYITYSGGDDLFAVGGWTRIIEFALTVHKDFQRFVSFNPHITISGGIALIRPSFPIRLAAEMAGDEEEKAKKIDTRDGRTKDALALFDEPFHWEELESLLEWADKIVKYIRKQDKKEVALRSLIRYFKQLRDQSFRPDGSQDLMWIPKAKHKIVYALKRRANLGNKEIESNQKHELAQLLSPIVHDSHVLENINFPASYILLKTRKPKSES